jgi:SAM-dependent methyltransferase
MDGDMQPSDATRRFSNRVGHYVRYRPGYPAGLLDVLRRESGLGPSWVVADVGSGTGLSAAPFLEAGHVVHGVEPNREMREAAETLLRGFAGFRSVDGRAEASGLAAASVDLVVAGQAFHWFEPAAARAEFTRILRPGGWVVLLWNNRRVDTTPFLREYEALILRHATDYTKVDHRNVDAARLAAFFGRGGYRRVVLDNEQVFDYDGLQGRLLSSSYVPGAGEPGGEDMLRDLRALFDRHAEGGRVRVEYDTEISVGRLA